MKAKLNLNQPFSSHFSLHLTLSLSFSLSIHLPLPIPPSTSSYFNLPTSTSLPLFSFSRFLLFPPSLPITPSLSPPPPLSLSPSLSFSYSYQKNQNNACRVPYWHPPTFSFYLPPSIHISFEQVFPYIFSLLVLFLPPLFSSSSFTLFTYPPLNGVHQPSFSLSLPSFPSPSTQLLKKVREPSLSYAF